MTSYSGSSMDDPVQSGKLDQSADRQDGHIGLFYSIRIRWDFLAKKDFRQFALALDLVSGLLEVLEGAESDRV